MAGSKASKKVEPWQTPEWRARSLTNLAALKEECRAHGLPASGTKAKLSQRLRDYASGVEPSKGKRRRGA